MALFYSGCEKDWLSYENKRLCFILVVRRIGSVMRINGSVFILVVKRIGQL